MLLPLALYIDVSDVPAEELAIPRRPAAGPERRRPRRLPRAAGRARPAVPPRRRPPPEPRRARGTLGRGPGRHRRAGRRPGRRRRTAVGEFDLNQAAIREAGRRARVCGGGTESLWKACQAQTRPRLEALARRQESVATWDDLVLPDAETVLLRHLVDQVRGRATVLRHWGFGESITRGSGITALFAGQSGHRQDPGRRGHRRRARAGPVPGRSLRGGEQVHRRDRAEPAPGVRRRRRGRLACCCSTRPTRCSASRSEVKDSHDRYANIEVNYLLQRMEDYRGVAILTTNQRHALDQAFLRRLRFVVSFPFPSPRERAHAVAAGVPGPRTGRRSRHRPAARNWPRPAA